MQRERRILHFWIIKLLNIYFFNGKNENISMSETCQHTNYYNN